MIMLHTPTHCSALRIRAGEVSNNDQLTMFRLQVFVGYGRAEGWVGKGQLVATHHLVVEHLRQYWY